MHVAAKSAAPPIASEEEATAKIEARAQIHTHILKPRHSTHNSQGHRPPERPLALLSPARPRVQAPELPTGAGEPLDSRTSKSQLQSEDQESQLKQTKAKHLPHLLWFYFQIVP